MKFLLNELNKLVDLSDKSTDELINIFTELAFEVEDIYPASQISGVKLAKTFERIAHPNADSLSFLKTEVNGKIYEVVCGAPNIDSDQIVAHAIPGSKVGGMIMAPKELRGIISNGMVVSISEILGVDKKIIESPENNSIVTFPKDTNLKQDVNLLLEIDKDIIDLDILPDRQYAANYYSMAREVAAYLDKKYEWPINKIDTKDTTNIEIELGNEANAIFVTDAKIKNISTPMRIKRVLYHSGIKPKNDISDLSSYVMLMTGAVTYIIDKTKKIKLDGRKLNDIDIFNSTAKLTESNDVMLVVVSSNERSNFMNEKNLNEIFGAKQIKGTTAESAGLSSSLFISLAHELGYLESFKSTVSKSFVSSREFKLDEEYVFNYLGQKFDLNEIKNKLEKLDFVIENNNYKIPSYRKDIEFRADIVEEISRFYGVSNIIPKPYKITNDKIHDEPHKNALIKITDELIKYGFNEAKTYQLLTEEQAKKYNIWSLEKYIKLREDYSFEFNTLQTSLLSGLIDSFKINHRNEMEDIRLFELGNIFHNEKPMYSLGILHDEHINDDEPILATKELLLRSIESFGVDINKITFENKIYDIFNPFISSVVKLDNEIIGAIGEIHPSILRENKFIRLDKIKAKLYYAEIIIEKLF